MNNSLRRVFLNTLVACVATILLFLRCSPEPVAGGGTEGGNVVSGAIVFGDGSFSAKVRVHLIPSEYNPGAVDNKKFVTSVTARDGSYSFYHIPQGNYSIEALDTASGKRSLVTGVAVSGTDVRVQDDTLRVPGAIKILLPENVDSITGYIYIPGTTILTRLSGNAGFVVINAPSATLLPPICYATVSNPATAVLRYDARVAAGDTTVVAYTGWKFAHRIGLNTTATGAGVSGNIVSFPVLIRLHQGNFDFSQANSDGSDIRFSRSDTVLLPLEIERWDAGGGFAELWVKVDTVFGNDSVQEITMYWGNAAATVRTESGTVFDTADGFQGVWHMGDVANDTVLDATVNRYGGISPDSTRPSVGEGAIGNCREFDGNKEFITMPNTAAGKLDFPQNGKYSVSAWVMADTFIDLQQVLVSKGRYQYFLWVDSTSWQFWEYQDRAGWDATAQQATLKQWVLLTGVRDGAAQRLYVNGEPADSLSLKSDYNTRNTANNLILGRAQDVATGSHANAGFCYFRGKIDEVRIMSTAQSPDWVRLCYMNQREDNKLVIFK